MADKIDVPAWFERALDPTTPTTKDQETMRTASTYVEDLGGEVIYPTIRMNKAGRLFKPKNPLKSALDNGDYILIEGPAGEETAMKATELSKRMSAAVAESRQPVDQTDKMIKEAEERMTSDTVSFNEGGLLDEGGTVDPVSGNDVPSGSTQKEVRDDIPAQLSEGEFVLPADVVRYIGLENLMELRNKAKQGLQQMEDMGQMGNSEEATMPDTAEMEVDIDALIDEFDPNDPETQKFNEGGMPTYAYQPPQTIYGQQNYNPYLRAQQPQQFTTGYMPQTTYTAPALPTVSQGQFTPTTSPQGGRVEQRQYIGPNGELRTFTFVDGKPTEEIPAGFKVYKPEEQATPQVTTPQVQQRTDTSDSSDDRAREQERQAEYSGWVDTMSKLSELDPEFAKDWENSQHNPKNGFSLGEFIKTGGLFGAIKNDYNLNRSAQKAYEGVAKQYGLDIEDYKNDFTFFGLDKYNEDALVRDAVAARDVSESLSQSLGRDIDPTDLERTDLDRDGDGRVEKEDLVDKSGKLTQQGLDLFNIEDEGDDPAESLTSLSDLGGTSDFTGSRGVDPNVGPGGALSLSTGPVAGLYDLDTLTASTTTPSVPTTTPSAPVDDDRGDDLTSTSDLGGRDDSFTGSRGVDENVGPGGQRSGGGGGGDSGGKIVCTAMNDAYGFGTFRQSIWLRHSAKLDPAYQKGYHRIFKPLVSYAYESDKIGHKQLRSVLEHIARHRTADIWKQRHGKRDIIGAIERAVLEPLCYIAGKIK